MRTLHEIAELNEMEIIDITEGINGYPRNTSYAIDGASFKDFAEVETFAEENNLEIIKTHSKNGWHFWENKGTAYKPYEITSEVYGDDYQLIPQMDEEDFIEDEVLPMLEDTTSFEEIQAILETKKEIWEEITKLDEGYAIITHEGRYYDTVQVICLSFSEDTHHYGIALIEKL